MASRDAGPQPLALGRASAQPGLGGGAGLVDKDEPGRVEVELALEPALASLQDVGPVLLGRMGGLFF